MAANVETMFYTRTAPWHGLGTRVLEAPTSSAALSLAGLDWRVVQKTLFTEDGLSVSGFKANVRDTDNQVLGVVSDRYKVVQNEDAFAFTDELLGEGVTYERLEVCRTAAVPGFWQSFPRDILSVGMKLHRIWSL